LVARERFLLLPLALHFVSHRHETERSRRASVDRHRP
jgi:hypothetical protein